MTAGERDRWVLEAAREIETRAPTFLAEHDLAVERLTVEDRGGIPYALLSYTAHGSDREQRFEFELIDPGDPDFMTNWTPGEWAIVALTNLMEDLDAESGPRRKQPGG